MSVPGRSLAAAGAAVTAVLALAACGSATAATVLLPGMAAVDAAPAVAGTHALFEPQTLSCEQPPVLGPAASATVSTAGHV